MVRWFLVSGMQRKATAPTKRHKNTVQQYIVVNRFEEEKSLRIMNTFGFARNVGFPLLLLALEAEARYLKKSGSFVVVSSGGGGGDEEGGGLSTFGIIAIVVSIISVCGCLCGFLARDAEEQRENTARLSREAEARKMGESALQAGKGGTGTIVAVTAKKPIPDSPAGLGLTMKRGVGVVITSIKTSSVFTGTKLKVGMQILSVNGNNCSNKSAGDVATLLRSIGGDILIFALDPEPDVTDRTDKVDDIKDGDLDI